MINLSSWDWGCKALFSNLKGRKYVTERIPKPDQICKIRFELVKLALATAARTSGLLDPDTIF